MQIKDLLSPVEKIELNKLEKIIRLRSKLPFLILIGVNSDKLGNSFLDYFKIFDNLDYSSLNPKTLSIIYEITSLRNKALYEKPIIIPLFKNNYSKNDLKKISSNLLFYRDSIPENRLKLIFIIYNDFLNYIQENAYDFISFSNFSGFLHHESEQSIPESQSSNSIELLIKNYEVKIKDSNLDFQIKASSLSKTIDILIKNNNYNKALSLAKNFLELSKREDSVYYSHTANSYIAACYIKKADYNVALKILKKILKTAKKYNYTNTGYILINIAHIHNLHGDTNIALKKYLEAKNFFLNRNDIEKASIAAINIGYIQLIKSNLKEAEKIFSSSLKFFQNSGNIIEQADAFNSLALLHLFKGDTYKAKNFLNKSFDILINNDHQEYLADQYYLKGSFLDIVGNSMKSLDFFDKADSTYQKTGSIKNRADSLLSKALIYEKLGKIDRSKTLLNQVNTIYSNFHLKHGLADSYKAFGILNIYTGNYNKAKSFFKRAQDEYKKVKNKSGEIIATYKLGEIFYHKKNYQTALKITTIAEKDSNLTSAYSRVLIYQNLSKIHLGLNNIEKACNYIKLSIDICKKSQFKEIEESSKSVLGQIHLSQQNPELAFKYIKPAHDFFKEAGLLKNQVEQLFNLGKIFKTQGNIEKAKQYFKKSLIKAKEIEYNLIIQEIESKINKTD